MFSDWIFKWRFSSLPIFKCAQSVRKTHRNVTYINLGRDTMQVNRPGKRLLLCILKTPCEFPLNQHFTSMNTNTWVLFHFGSHITVHTLILDRSLPDINNNKTKNMPLRYTSSNLFNAYIQHRYIKIHAKLHLGIGHNWLYNRSDDYPWSLSLAC